ncbi:MAG TPA: glycosyl hydrolase family 65 protein [Solirubrobacteraceae bacterium]|nr:glycosyl hydrolase family 65 protein [Solirubrobacteraceae bacterium]
MIRHPAFEVSPWSLRETELDLERLAQTESVFALSNGHIGLRGNLDEGEPHGLPGTYLAGFYEARPLPYAEPGYGDPEEGQAVVNVTNGKIIRLLVGDSPFDVRYGSLVSHERELDLRDGVLRRSVEWTSPSHQSVRVRSTRLVSLSQRSIAAISYEVEPVDAAVRVVLQSELIANEQLPAAGSDPRAGAAIAQPLRSELFESTDTRAVLVHRTAASGLRVAVAMRHEIFGPDALESSVEAFEDIARLVVTATLEPGQTLRIVKYLGYGWSRVRSTPALLDQVSAALSEAHVTDWAGLCREQREYLDGFWERADVEIEGDAELQQATRFGMFHVLQAGARNEQRAIAAKGLTGSGYDGHTFWDSEAFVLPLLTYTLPEAAADALRWRHRTLDRARARAAQLELKGAAFPWRTIHGEECSGYWPAGTGAFHINADIAAAVTRYQRAVADEPFERETGAELLIETARLWYSLGHHDAHGGFRIDGVTGPDEYSAIADNNVYTNLMAQRNLRAAADAAERFPEVARGLQVDDSEMAAWRDAAAAVLIPYDEHLGVHPQAEGYTEHEVWNFEATKPEQYPLLLHFAYFDLYRKQVVKQADLVLALHLCGDSFTPEQKLANFGYYEPLTVRDSSLSACTQAVVAAEVGYPQLGYAYFREAALMDLDDLEHNVRDGLHIASLAGAWSAAVAGFGGMRDEGDQLSFRPQLPEEITRLSFRLCYRGATIAVQIEREQATYRLITGTDAQLLHYGSAVQITADTPATLPIPAAAHLAPPRQPPGRELSQQQ